MGTGLTHSCGPRAIEAVVQAGGTESRYLRMGAGARLVLLVRSQRERWIDSVLLRALAERFCVVVPELPAEAGDPDEPWLLGFIDGLGIERCVIVAERALASPLIRAARADDRIERLAFIGAAVARGDPDGLLSSPCPTLSWGAAPDAAVGRIGPLVHELAAFVHGDVAR